MMASKPDNLFTGELKFNEPMSRHTTWRVGGVAEHYFVPADINDLSRYLQSLGKDENIFWLGLGSNLLVRDGGIKGSVIATANALGGIEMLDNNIIEVGAGVPCAILARFCARNNLINGEFFAGIPGVVGGALRMNAGAFGGETWAHVEEVETINRDGLVKWRGREDYEVSYRSVNGPANEWFTKARFKFETGDGELAAQAIKQLLSKRSATQPTGTANCGSVFKNPEAGFAAKLIEQSGLKNHRIGGAVVSDKHTNFIINDGTATAADIETLIDYVQDQVFKKTGITLLPEVHIVGERKDD
ncbi:MAG: UDP-N-acetylmuramate dehydrogenase [Gammaproteobacteria bacterium]|nr:UDP-N-acetylmuramate dehydrogenase [Gammaproteobacteria bacterium]